MFNIKAKRVLRVQKLGDVINAARLKKDWSLRDLAKEADVHHSYLQRVENGTYSPSREVVERLAGALGIDKAVLLQLAGYAAEDPLIQAIGLKRYNQLRKAAEDPTKRKQLENMLDFIWPTNGIDR